LPVYFLEIEIVPDFRVEAETCLSSLEDTPDYELYIGLSLILSYQYQK